MSSTQSLSLQENKNMRRIRKSLKTSFFKTIVRVKNGPSPPIDAD